MRKLFDCVCRTVRRMIKWIKTSNHTKAEKTQMDIAKPLDAITIAEYMITKCALEKSPISNLPMQKILFFLQRDYLRKHKKPLFFNDIQAWQYGPVVPDVYFRFCGSSVPIAMLFPESTVSDEIAKEIDPIIEREREREPWDLVRETHKEGGAWDLVFRAGLGEMDVIPPELIEVAG